MTMLSQRLHWAFLLLVLLLFAGLIRLHWLMEKPHHTASRRLNRGTPAFIVAGCMKCGTSALFSYIAEHDGVVRLVSITHRFNLNLNRNLVHCTVLACSTGRQGYF